MQQDPKTGRTTVSFEELAYSDMLLVEGLVELLDEKGLLTKAEIMQRLKQLRAQAGVRSLGDKQ